MSDFEFENQGRPQPAFRFRERPGQVRHGFRASPWHAFEPQDESPPPREEKWKDTLQRSMLFRWLSNIQDHWVGWRERWYQKRRGRPSMQAQDEWWRYYEGLYQGKSPDVQKYARLLRRHGVPDWINPYGIGEPEHYEFHPDGLMLADVQAVLMGLQIHWGLITLDEDTQTERRIQRQLAAACLGLAFALGKTMPIMSARVAQENLALVVMEAALTNLQAFGVKPMNVLNGAVRAGVLADDEARLLEPILKQMPVGALEKWS